MRRVPALLGLLCCAAAAASKGEIAWRNNSESVWEEARQKGRPVLVEAWADWCAPCQRMDREVWSDPRVIALSKKFECITIDLSREPRARTENLHFGGHGRYEVRVFPTVMILDPWREMLVFSEGFIYPKDLLAILNEIPSDYNPARPWREALEARRDNARALEHVGELYDRSSAFGIANRYYREALGAGAAKEDEALREDLMFGIANNEIRRADWNAARKAFEAFRAAFPESRRSAQALLGLILADVRQQKRGAAEKRLAELRAAYPGSDAVADAERLVGAARTSARRRP